MLEAAYNRHRAAFIFLVAGGSLFSRLRQKERCSERNYLKTQHQMRRFAGLDEKKNDFAGRILDSFEQ